MVHTPLKPKYRISKGPADPRVSKQIEELSAKVDLNVNSIDQMFGQFNSIKNTEVSKLSEDIRLLKLSTKNTKKFEVELFEVKERVSDIKVDLKKLQLQDPLESNRLLKGELLAIVSPLKSDSEKFQKNLKSDLSKIPLLTSRQRARADCRSL